MNYFLFLIAGVALLVALYLLIRDVMAADPECDHDEGEEEIVAMGGQVDDSSDESSETDEEPSEEEDDES